MIKVLIVNFLEVNLLVCYLHLLSILSKTGQRFNYSRIKPKEIEENSKKGVFNDRILRSKLYEGMEPYEKPKIDMIERGWFSASRLYWADSRKLDKKSILGSVEHG